MNGQRVLLQKPHTNASSTPSRCQPRSRRCCSHVRADAASNEKIIVVGDIGGTNARLGLWRADANTKESEEIFHTVTSSGQMPFFEDAVAEFLANKHAKGFKVDAAAIAVAGAVANNRCAMTNTKWVIDGQQLQDTFGFKAAVLNDFEAVGYGIPALGPDDVVPLNDATPTPEAPKVVMGPGTGLGAAQLMWDTGLKAYKVWPGEGAHATFAPRGYRQAALAMWVTYKMGHCEVEELACGHGIELIYEFLMQDYNFHRPDNRAIIKKTAPEITSAAMDNSDDVAAEAVDIFLSIVGAEAGAMALRCLAKGGVYIAGGIVPRVMKRVKQGVLLDAFINRAGRDRFAGILQETPLYAVVNTAAGIIGSREVALRLVAQS